MRTVLALSVVLIGALAAAVVPDPVSSQERAPASPGSADLPLNLIKLPPGFKIEVYASGVTNARELAIGPKGTVFVGSRNKPDGVAVHNGSLYFGEISRISRFDNIESRLESPGEPVVVNDALPKDEHHGQKFIAFGPDGLLYLPVGAPCNICERPDDQRFATILRMKPDGTGTEV